MLEEILKDLNTTLNDVDEIQDDMYTVSWNNTTSSLNDTITTEELGEYDEETYDYYLNETLINLNMTTNINNNNNTFDEEDEIYELFNDTITTLNNTTIDLNDTSSLYTVIIEDVIECLSEYEEKIEYCDISPELKDYCYTRSDETTCESTQITDFDQNSISCHWNKYKNECTITNEQNTCLNYTDKSTCELKDCTFKAKCITPCSECEMCTNEYHSFLINNNNILNKNTTEASELLLDYCIYYNEHTSLQNQFSKCYDLIDEIWNSQKYEYIERPAAICHYFSICPEICYNSTDYEISSIDLCSNTGFVMTNEDALLLIYNENNGCYTDEDCLMTEICDLTKSHQECTCDPYTGLDACVTLGTCVDWCLDQTSNINQFNALYHSCLNDDDCQMTSNNVDYTCNPELPCFEMSCQDGTVSISGCHGICEPEIRTIVSAQFSDTGNEINVKLNFPANSGVMSCHEIFDEVTSLMLGDAMCHIDDTDLKISLHNSALISVGDTLSISSDQNVLIDIYTEVPFETMASNDIVNITRCDMCASPNIKISYLNKISKGCGNAVPDAIFDASMTFDSTGRGLNCIWASDDCTHDDCDVLNDILEDNTRNARLILTLSGNEILSLSDAIYHLKLTCENFLFEEDSYDLSFEITSAPMPSILVPSESDFVISKDLHLTAYIDQKSVCPSVKVSYNWTSADNVHWDAIPVTGLQTKDLK